MTASLRRTLWAGAAVAAFAFAYLYLCGLNRFLFATHFAYSGGFEVLNGRLPYRDLHMPVGPLLFLIQALFFKVLGLNYAAAYVGHAALVNAFAALTVFDLVRRKTGRLSWSLMAGLMTGAWFYPTYHAAPWYDQEAFAFQLAGVWLLARSGSGLNPSLLRLAAGLAASFAFFTKQSSGAVGLGCLGLYALQAHGWRGARDFAFGALAGLAALSGLFSSWGGWETFRFHFIERPIGARPLPYTRSPVFWLTAAAAAALLGRSGPLKGQWASAVMAGAAAALVPFTDPLYAVFLLPLAALPWLKDDAARALFCALTLLQIGGRSMSMNELKIFWPFISLFWAIAASGVSERIGARRRPIAADVAWLAGAFLLLLGVRVSYWHGVASIAPVVTYLAAAAALAAAAVCLRRKQTAAAAVFMVLSLAAGQRGLSTHRRRAADPAFVREHARSLAGARTSVSPQLKGVRMHERIAASLDKVVPHLRALEEKRKPFFAYPVCELLYPLLGQPSPQAEVWFDWDFTFRPGDGTEERVLASLRAQRAGTLVMCGDFESSPGFEKAAFDNMPGLARLLAATRPELETPFFRVYPLKPWARN